MGAGGGAVLAPAPWVTVFTFVGAVALSGAGTVWGMRHLIRGGNGLALHILTIGCWSFSYGVSLGVAPAEAIRIRNLAQVFVIIGPASLVAFAARFTGRDAGYERWGRSALLASSIGFSVLAVTNVHGWFLPHGRDARTGTITQPGPVYLVGIAILTVLVITASVWLLAYARTAPRLRKRESTVLVIGITIAWIGGGLTALRIYPFGVDATSLSFIALATAIAFVVLTDRTSELRRIWEVELVSGYGDGFLLVTNEGHVQHGNDASMVILGRRIAALRGRLVQEVLGTSPELEAMLRTGRGSTMNTVMVDGAARELLIEVHRVRDRAARELGTALHLRDVSAHYLDPLTGVGNRRHFLEHAQRALAARGSAPVTVALLDLDHLKRINDTGGHAQGDAALARLGQVLAALTPTSAACGRIGGDEFAVLLPDRDVEATQALLDLVRRGLAADDPQWTLSAGVASVASDDSLLAALARADAALLQAKQDGRNRVRVQELRDAPHADAPRTDAPHVAHPHPDPAPAGLPEGTR